ncbi:RidA family protein [Celeribacter neptunius]|uniref:Enamine deaminase RidA, house cleaning of reactive enamine intermediates, YjgF/YER057c/UK114 family n=1 Tax=Celeribacter neptunius TaxID=588602 RepID=A0A1I3NA32_9RHOB|nr:RidA family protein [Celeribacter neptunius]SFJ06074.1 Enamine deaminase RidA, house cleaning of reactive enamine intermediates, YjgF/YER057c/UK114 family [Celeribacter neptunius]
MHKPLTPTTIAAPFGAYNHGIASAPAGRVIVTSGQLGLAADGSCAPGVREQAEQCFANIDAILREAGVTRDSVIRVSGFVTRREDFPIYMAVRDAWLAEVAVKPASTLLIVTGFTREEFKVEVEVTAVAPA